MINEQYGLIKNINIRITQTIRDAFELLNGKYGMLLTVVNDKDEFRGVVTEGDLRRVLLSGNSLDTKLDLIINKQPIILKLKDFENINNLTQIFNQLNQKYGKQLLQARFVPIPVIKNKKVIGLITLESIGLSDGNYIKCDGINAKPCILVVGGAGYIGSVLVRMLLKTGFRVRVLDNMLYNQDSLSDIEDKEHFSLTIGDATNINDMLEAVRDIDAVVFLAEIVGDPACKFIPDMSLKLNYLAVSTMATLCSHLNVNRFIYTSSCSVYGASNDQKTLLDENSFLNPVSHYGRMKILSEQAVFNQPNPIYAPTILRLATVFGYSYRPRFDLVVNTFAKNAYFSNLIEVQGGNQWRPNVHVTDVASAIIEILKSPLEKVRKQIFNVGSNSENYTINHLAGFAKKVFPNCKIQRRKNLIDTRNYRVSFNKIEKILGYKANVSVIEGYRELRNIFNKGLISNPNDIRYSNINALKELYCEY